MTRRKIYLNIGSNSGDRRANIAAAVAAVAAMPQVVAGSVRISDIVESEPWGYESDSPYLNVGAALEADIDSPEEFLADIQACERAISDAPHRNADGSYRDRPIDIDIIAIDDIVCHTPTLTLPHPRMHQRAFVLEPMRQLAPAWRHPLLGLTTEEME